MPSFQDSIVLFVIALLLFGPKKLPVLARELGKWIGEFRRASNEFKMQMDEELRAVEQADRQKQIAAMEAAAPVAPALAEPEHPHLAGSDSGADGTSADDDPYAVSDNDPGNPGSGYEDNPSGGESSSAHSEEFHSPELAAQTTPTAAAPDAATPAVASPALAPPVAPIPIATSGELNLMPPATGLPVGRSSGRKAHGSAVKPPPPEDSSSLGGLFDSIPSVSPESAGSARIAESNKPATSSKAATDSSPSLANSEVLTESETHAG